MKLHLDTISNLNIVTGYGSDHVLVNRQRHEGNLLLSPSRILEGWAPDASADLSGLSATDFAAVLEFDEAEILIVGTGRRQRFPSPALLRPLIEAQIGFEFMDFAAACRTYNILAGEARAVALALLFERQP